MYSAGCTIQSGCDNAKLPSVNSTQGQGAQTCQYLAVATNTCKEQLLNINLFNADKIEL